MADDLVDGQVDRLAQAGSDRPDDRRPDGRVGIASSTRMTGAASRTRCRRRSTMPSCSARSSSKASRRSAASRPWNEAGIVRLLDGSARSAPGPRRERSRRAGTPDRHGRPVERLADGGAKAGRGQPGRQRIDRHDPARVQQLRLADLAGEHLELGVVDRQPSSEVLDLPGHDDLGSDVESPLDEPAPEPRRVDRARVVLEAGDRPLGPARESRARHGRRRRSAWAEIDVPVGDQTADRPSLRISRRSSYRRGRWNSRSRTS